MRKHQILAVLLLLPAPAHALPPDYPPSPETGCSPVILSYTPFRVSGAGNTVTTGNAAAGSVQVQVASLSTWSPEQGVRIARAGRNGLVSNADSGWTGRGPLAIASHDSTLKVQGAASLKCSFLGTPATPADVSYCEYVYPSSPDIEYDEVRVWVHVSRATYDGDLLLEFIGPLGSWLQMPLPAITTRGWIELYLRMGSTSVPKAGGGAVDRLSLSCRAHCDGGLVAHLDDVQLVTDYIGIVQTISPPYLLLNPASTLPLRTVSNTPVYHDDSKAVQAWLNTSPECNHIAPAGVYYLSAGPPPYSGDFPIGPRAIRSGTAISCPQRAKGSPDAAIFKNSGGLKSGLSEMMAAFTYGSSAQPPRDIRISDCGFDVNGRNPQNDAQFLLAFRAFCSGVPSCPPVENIQILNNHLYDSNPPSQAGCESNGHLCPTRQRTYVAAFNAHNVWVLDNRLSHGGRIAVGRPADTAYIKRNDLDFVNDNGITLMDSGVCPTTGCVTRNILVEDNHLSNTITSGITFGTDGEAADDPNMRFEDITIRNNTLSGYFGVGIIGSLPAGGAHNIVIEDNQVIADPSVVVTRTNRFGIFLKRGAATPKQATSGLRLVGNSVEVHLPNGMLVVGMGFTGPLNDLVLENNAVHCVGCSVTDPVPRMEDGISVSGDLIDGFDAHGNLVTFCGNAMQIQTGAANLLLYSNAFLSSTSRGGAQLFLHPGHDRAVVATIYDNDILSGKGSGMHCYDPDAWYLLSSLPTFDLIADNNFGVGTGAANDGGAITGWCPGYY